MQQQQDNDIFELDSSVIKNQDSTLAPKNNSRETEPEPVLKSEVLMEKSLSERWKTNRFWLVSAIYYVLRSVWMIVMVIGGFIVWLISLLFI